jgi:C1A family cysteine protease
MEGSCVGFAFGHSALAKPSLIWSVDEQVARGIYFSAQLVDEWEGGAYPGIDPNSPEYYEGTSVLAGAKAARELGHFNNYEWAYNVNDLILAVGYKGPAVLGIYWFWGMDNVNEQGYVVPSGDIAGGHAIIIIGVNIKERYFLLQNSWSKEWGVNGRCKISFDDMDLLLGLDGEACVPLLRRMPYTIGGGKQIRIAA